MHLNFAQSKNQQPTQHPITDNTPERQNRQRTLKLNGQGGFGFPTSTEKVEEPQESGAGPDGQMSKRRKRTKRYLLRLRYGVSDLKGRMTIGKAIDQILKNKTTSANVGLPLQQQSGHDSRKTHPFFTSKPRDSLVAGLATSKPDAKKPDSSSGPPPIKSYTTPRKHAPRPSIGGADHAGPVPMRTGIVRTPGSIEAAWPSQGMAKVPNGAGTSRPQTSISVKVQSSKRKGHIAWIPLENQITWLNYKRAIDLKLHTENSRHFGPGIRAGVRLPGRLLLSGQQIQQITSQKLSRKVPLGGQYSGPEAHISHHPAILYMNKMLSSSLSALDASTSESQAWTQKYAPKRTDHVLQPGPEPRILHSWLQSHVVDSINSSLEGPKSSENRASRKKRRKRKNGDDLDDFIVNSDDDEAEMTVLVNDQTGPLNGSREGDGLRSTVLTGSDEQKRSNNTVLISGPVGCGKTALVLATAKELGFDIFEIGPNAKRSRQDILDKIGDMSLNHQVRGVSQIEDDEKLSESDSIPTEIDAKQSSLNSFFKTKVEATVPKENRAPPTTKANPQTVVGRAKQQSSRRQALILFEEVDILFDDDKSFWETVLSLALLSKRPIIMTCNDESSVPFELLSLYAIMRLKPVPQSLAVDYIMRVAACEGHLLEPKVVASLLEARGRDLRSTMTELNFWCQMAVGDRRGGIEWIPKHWPPERNLDAEGRRVRTLSIDTYWHGLGTLDGRTPADFAGSGDHFHDVESNMLGAWHEHAVDPLLLAQSATALVGEGELQIWEPQLSGGARPCSRLAKRIGAIQLREIYLWKRLFSLRYSQDSSGNSRND